MHWNAIIEVRLSSETNIDYICEDYDHWLQEIPFDCLVHLISNMKLLSIPDFIPNIPKNQVDMPITIATPKSNLEQN